MIEDDAVFFTSASYDIFLPYYNILHSNLFRYDSIVTYSDALLLLVV